MDRDLLALRMRTGGSIPPDRWNRLLDLIQASRIAKVFGGTLSKFKQGCVVRITQRPGGDSLNHPWEILNVSDEDNAIVSVRFGMANTFHALNYNDHFTLTVTSHLWLVLSLNSAGSIVSIQIDHGAAIPSNPDPAATVPSEWYIPIGLVTLTDGRITDIAQSLFHSLSVAIVISSATCAEVTRTLSIKGI